MNIIFIHKHFPAQFSKICSFLIANKHHIVAIGDKNCSITVEGARCLFYDFPNAPSMPAHPYLHFLDEQVKRGLTVQNICLSLKNAGYHPDLIVYHPGWGEGLFLRDAFPRSAIIAYCEFFYHAENSDCDFDPEFPPNQSYKPLIRLHNTAFLHSLESADLGLSPTKWQKSLFPSIAQSKIRVVHEGVDVERIKPDPNVELDLPNGAPKLTSHDEIITYATRGLEPYRGFHVFMRALPLILAQRPRCRALILGDDEVRYGQPLPPGQTYKEKYLQETGLNSSRIHFLGFLPFDDYIKVLQLSSAHIYFTYPFVLSWSLVEAMSAGCLVIGSDTAPVQEIVEHGKNGFLADFFDHERLAEQVVDCLENRENMRPLRENARETVVRNYNLRIHSLPALHSLLHEAINARKSQNEGSQWMRQ